MSKNISEFSVKSKENLIINRLKIAREKYISKDQVLYNLFSQNISYNEKMIIFKERIKLRKRYLNYITKANSLLIDVKNGIDNIDLEENNKKIMDKSIKLDEKVNVLNKKNRKLTHKNFIKGALISSALLFSLGLSSFMTYKVKDTLIDDTTSEISKELDDTINRATHTKYGNVDYSYGDIFKVEGNNLDEVITYINYDEIADFIENCDDPDLALFTLYKEYGTTNIPKYNGITNKTCMELEFENDDIKDFKDYIKANGYDSYKEYYKESKKAILNDYLGKEKGLENISVSVKKLK